MIRSPIQTTHALIRKCKKRLRKCDALDIRPCALYDDDGEGREYITVCEPHEAHFWTVYGQRRTGEMNALEDFKTEAEARAFREQLLAAYPYLSPHQTRPA